MLEALYYEKKVKDEILLTVKEVVENVQDGGSNHVGSQG